MDAERADCSPSLSGARDRTPARRSGPARRPSTMCSSWRRRMPGRRCSMVLTAARRPGSARVERAWAIAHPGPYSYGDPPSGEPPFDLLPPPARFVNQAVMWGIAQFFGKPRRTGGGRGGRYTGIGRSIHRHGAGGNGRTPIRQDPGGRRGGVPDDVAGLVGRVPEHGGAGHRQWRDPLASGDHRPGARDPGGGRTPATPPTPSRTDSVSPSTAIRVSSN